MGQRDFALLFLCITDLGAEIVRDLTIDKIGKHFSFTDYLATVKHHMYHQWDKKKRICCECPKPGCAIKKTVQLSKNIFEKLFVYVKGVCHNGYTRKNGTALVQICVCEYNVRNVSITDLDLTELNSVLLNSPLSSFLTPCENIKLSALMNIRNKVCHSIGSNTFSELELTSLWTELFEALCKLSTIQSKYLKMMIEDKKQKDLSETELTELLLKVDKIEKDTEMFTYHIEQTKRLATEFEDIKLSYKRLEEDNRNLREQMGELQKYVGKCTASISITSLATPGSHLEEVSKEIDIKMKLTTIDEEKMRNGLERETLLNRNDGLIFNAVKEGCILLEISALSNIFSSEKILNSTLQALVERILTAGEVNTSEKAEIFLNLCIKSPLTAEEEKNIRSVCAGSSELQSDFINRLLEKDALQDLFRRPRVVTEEYEMTVEGRPRVGTEEYEMTVEGMPREVTEEYEMTVEDMEDTKINTGGTKDKEGCQILQNDNEEVVKCPECLHNFKCALCCSKNQTVQEMRSKLERDNIQIKQVMRLLQGLNSTKYELPESSIKKIKTTEYDLTVKGRQEHTETLFVDEPCDVCGFKEKEDDNELVYCDKCNVLVHQVCYNIPVVPDDDWFCRPCLEGVQPKCVLCDQMKGAMVKTSDGKKWAHVQCVWWLPDIKFEDGKQLEKMRSLDKISKRRWKLECCLCKKQKGACIQCCVKGCFKAFHSRCAFKNGLRMQIIEEPVLQFKPHCEEHSKSSVTETTIAKRQGKRGRPSKRVNSEEGRKLQSESPKKKRKVGGKRTPDITVEEITSQNDRGDTCLHVAALKSDLKQIRHLLDRISKASLIQNCIDIQNNNSRTPLFISVLNNDSDIVELFLQHGANPNIFAEATGGQEKQRDAAIHVAASGGSSYLKTVEALLADETISLNSFNTEGYTALHLAVMAHGREISKKEHVDSECIIEKLIDAGIDPNLQETKSGRTPLMCAIEKLDITLVERFVRRIDHTKMRQLLKSESFDGKSVHSIIEELKDSFAKNNYRKLTDLLRNINEDPLSHYQ